MTLYVCKLVFLELNCSHFFVGYPVSKELSAVHKMK